MKHAIDGIMLDTETAQAWAITETTETSNTTETMYLSPDGNWIHHRITRQVATQPGIYPDEQWTAYPIPMLQLEMAYQWFVGHSIDMPPELIPFAEAKGENATRARLRREMIERNRQA